MLAKLENLLHQNQSSGSGLIDDLLGSCHSKSLKTESKSQGTFVCEDAHFLHNWRVMEMVYLHHVETVSVA